MRYTVIIPHSVQKQLDRLPMRFWGVFSGVWRDWRHNHARPM
jgi:hypothetical protein